MYWTQLTIATIREERHPLLMRAGYVRGGEYLTLGQMALERISALKRQETDFARVLDACGICFTQAGDAFYAETESGEDVLVRGTNYAARFDDAASLPSPPATADPAAEFAPEEFSTPGVKTIAQIAEFTKLPVTSQMKSLVMVADSALVLVLLRGDHQLNEAKLSGFLAAKQLRQATGEELRTKFGADAGSLGPVNIQNVRIIADEALRGRRNMISGANRNDFHLRHVTPGRDFACEYAELRRVTEADGCVNGGPLTFHKARLLYSDESILETVAEQNHHADGLCMPAAIAPFPVLIAPLHPSHLDTGKALHDTLQAVSIGALLDDRDVRPGVKFKDADLIGLPYRLNLGKKVTDGIVEVVQRRPREISEVKLDDVAAWLKERLVSQA